MAWTNEQLLAINSEGQNIIVSAGAGSGKTAVVSFSQLAGINTAATGGSQGHTHDIKFVSTSTTKVGSGTAFTTSTLQPYIVVYMWRRTA